MMKSKVARCVFLLPLLVGFSSAGLTLSKYSHDAQVGEDLMVTCHDRINGAKVWWTAPNKKILGEKSKPLARMGSLGLQLLFININKKEAGIYTCHSKNKEKEEFVLTVLEPTEFKDTPTFVVLHEGENATIRCDATNGNTKVLIDNETPKNDSTKFKLLADGLLIQNVSIEDSNHEYSCEAVNSILGEIKNRTIIVQVNHAPKPTRYVSDEPVYAFIGGYLNLSCEVDAVPVPKFKWTRKGSNHEKMVGLGAKEVNVTGGAISLLQLKILSHQDFGDYRCEAKNSEGTKEIIFSVLNGTKPKPPKSIEVLETTSTTAVLKIEPPEPTDEMDTSTLMEPTGYLIEYSSTEPSSSESGEQFFTSTEPSLYTIEDIAANTTYHVRAATKNRAGYSDFTNFFINVTTDASVAFHVTSNIYNIFLISIFKYFFNLLI